MIQIVYISSAVESWSTEQLLELLQQCLRNNAARGVTGMLLYGEDTFLQALEGEDAVIDELVERIARDPRHAKVQLLHRREVERRQYSDWSMGFKRISDQELSSIKGLKNFGAKDFNFDFLVRNDGIVDTLMEHYRAPHWDPLVRELDAKDKVIEHLEKALLQSRGSVEIATLVLESIADASKGGTLSDRHIRLCESALADLRGAWDPSRPATGS